MDHLLFIYNPTAGKGQVAEKLSSVVDVFTKAGWLVTVCPTQSKGDATRIARELGPSFSRVVCAGGDGTLSETVTGLMDLKDPPLLGYIPSGSTNDCATTFGLSKVPRQAALAAAETGIPTPIDIGRLNGSPFVYVAAFGAFTKVAYDTPQDLKKTFGHLAYVMEGIVSLPTISPIHLKVEYDKGVIEDDFFFGMVSNALSIGGMRPPNSSNVVLDDGLFEVYLVKKPVTLADVANGFQAFLSMKPGDPGSLIQFQTSRLVITGQEPLHWTIDGEYGGGEVVNVVENCRKALTILRGK